MPPFLTYVSRVSDGLPLVASFAPATSGGRSEVRDEHKTQAKELLKNVGSATSKMSIDTSYQKVFHLLLRDSMCILTMTESSYPKRLAFLYLEEIADLMVEELTKDYGSNQWMTQVGTAARPYQFIKYDVPLQRKQKEFVDPTSRQNTSKLNSDLADIHSIMKKNIQEVLNRGEKLEHMSQISSNLVEGSKKFKWGTKKLTWQARLNQYGPMVAGSTFVLFVLYLKFVW
eukprot:scaffold96573_cov52-Attheya_sp.AAC.3